MNHFVWQYRTIGRFLWWIVRWTSEESRIVGLSPAIPFPLALPRLSERHRHAPSGFDRDENVIVGFFFFFFCRVTPATPPRLLQWLPDHLLRRCPGDWFRRRVLQISLLALFLAPCGEHSHCGNHTDLHFGSRVKGEPYPLPLGLDSLQ